MNDDIRWKCLEKLCKLIEDDANNPNFVLLIEPIALVDALRAIMKGSSSTLSELQRKAISDGVVACIKAGKAKNIFSPFIKCSIKNTI